MNMRTVVRTSDDHEGGKNIRCAIRIDGNFEHGFVVCDCDGFGSADAATFGREKGFSKNR